MKELYKVLGTTKQAHHQMITRLTKNKEDKQLIIQNIIAVRSLHPKIGAKKIYKILQPESIGRDWFIEIYREAGFNVIAKRNYRKTTHSTPSLRYTNLTSGLIFNDINQLWTSDITYLQIGHDTFLYLVFILDVYSRRILGYNVSDSLKAESNIKALKMALKERKIAKYPNLIHHSDKGVQYTSNAYIELLTDHQIKISMCNNVYENTHIERINGTFKNEYLSGYTIKNIPDCQRALKESVELYNDMRPHWSLPDLKTPSAYEDHIKNIPSGERFKLKIYSDENELKKQIYKQVELFF
jgi:transposase InsO family protein